MASTMHMSAAALPLAGRPLSLPQNEPASARLCRLDLDAATVDRLNRAARFGQAIELSLGKKQTLTVGDSIINLNLSHQATSPHFEIYTRTTEKLQYLGRVEHILKSAKMQYESTESAEAKLLATLNAETLRREENSMRVVNLDTGKRGTDLNAMVRAPAQSTARPAAVGAASKRPLDPTRLAPPAAKSAAEKIARSNAWAYKLALFHMLAVGPATQAEIIDRTKIPADDLPKLLSRHAKQGVKAGTWELEPACFKELDVQSFAYSKQEDRDAAQSNAIRAFDRLRLSKTDPLWQKLLPPSDRNKGIVLSRLNLGGQPAISTDHRKLLAGAGGDMARTTANKYPLARKSPAVKATSVAKDKVAKGQSPGKDVAAKKNKAQAPAKQYKSTEFVTEEDDESDDQIVEKTLAEKSASVLKPAPEPKKAEEKKEATEVQKAPQAKKMALSGATSSSIAGTKRKLADQDATSTPRIISSSERMLMNAVRDSKRVKTNHETSGPSSSLSEASSRAGAAQPQHDQPHKTGGKPEVDRRVSASKDGARNSATGNMQARDFAKQPRLGATQEKREQTKTWTPKPTAHAGSSSSSRTSTFSPLSLTSHGNASSASSLASQPVSKTMTGSRKEKSLKRSADEDLSSSSKRRQTERPLDKASRSPRATSAGTDQFKTERVDTPVPTAPKRAAPDIGVPIVNVAQAEEHEATAGLADVQVSPTSSASASSRDTVSKQGEAAKSSASESPSAADSALIKQYEELQPAFLEAFLDKWRLEWSLHILSRGGLPAPKGMTDDLEDRKAKLTTASNAVKDVLRHMSPAMLTTLGHNPVFTALEIKWEPVRTWQLVPQAWNSKDWDPNPFGANGSFHHYWAYVAAELRTSHEEGIKAWKALERGTPRWEELKEELRRDLLRVQEVELLIGRSILAEEPKLVGYYDDLLRHRLESNGTASE